MIFLFQIIVGITSLVLYIKRLTVFSFIPAIFLGHLILVRVIEKYVQDNSLDQFLCENKLLVLIGNIYNRKFSSFSKGFISIFFNLRYIALFEAIFPFTYAISVLSQQDIVVRDKVIPLSIGSLYYSIVSYCKIFFGLFGNIWAFTILYSYVLAWVIARIDYLTVKMAENDIDNTIGSSRQGILFMHDSCLILHIRLYLERFA